MFYDFSYLFILFLIYSIVGYVCELVYCSIELKKVVLNRGFLLGPYLPIYGICCILMNLFLEKYADDIVVLFIMSVVLCSIAEYLTSYILEKIFRIRWWDYSNKKFNLEGRICLLNSTLFGIGGVVLIRFINPFIMPLIEKLPSTIIIIIGIFLLTIFITDLVISVITLCKIKITSNKYLDHDATEEIKLLVNKKLEKGYFFIRRLLNAFPSVSGKDMKKLNELRKKVNEIRNKIITKKTK